MYTNTEPKSKSDIQDLEQEQILMKTQIRYILNDVNDLKGMVKEIITNQKKLEQQMMMREQFFIDSVMQMKEMAKKILEKQNGNGNGEKP